MTALLARLVQADELRVGHADGVHVDASEVEWLVREVRAANVRVVTRARSSGLSARCRRRLCRVFCVFWGHANPPSVRASGSLERPTCL